MVLFCITFVLVYIISVVGVLIIGNYILSETEKTVENYNIIVKSALTPVYNTMIVLLAVSITIYAIIKILISGD